MTQEEKQQQAKEIIIIMGNIFGFITDHILYHSISPVICALTNHLQGFVVIGVSTQGGG